MQPFGFAEILIYSYFCIVLFSLAHLQPVLQLPIVEGRFKRTREALLESNV